MSASREKKVRQERGTDYVSPKERKEQEEKKATNRATAIFAVCALVFVAFVVFTVLNNSGVFKRNAKAATVNGETYSVSDVAYHYYNARSGILNSNTDLSNSSLRTQEYTASEDFDTWYDYALDQTFRSIANVDTLVKAAKAEGFTSDEVDKTVNETMESIKTNAASSGYTLSDFIKAIFGGLVTKGEFTDYLSDAALAEAFANSKAQPSGYSEEALQAELDADPNAYATVSYEALVFTDSSFATDAVEATDTTPAVEADDGSAAALAAAQNALTLYRSGSSLESLSEKLGGSYLNTSTTYGSDSEMLDWLFDDARKEGDADVLDYTYYGISMGSVVVVFHSKALADYHTVSVRHILVEDEQTAKDLLAEFEAGEQTEDAFAALATEHSTDTGSAENGGLYENVYKGQMVEPFETWCFDESRQTGDTGIVATDYGYHVMYFVSRNEYAFWQQLAANKLAAAWQETLSTEVESEQLDGMKYIDPS
ncbi:MAG: peptidylprolyl isomerase [Oscillospiraceae bacterium]|nr:peptidylprolyl isomerase [Oscillospiraceae bacterium]